MDLLDYLPFIQFIRDDKETVDIMKTAMDIVPRVCHILDHGVPQPQPQPSTSGTTSAPSTSAPAPQGAAGSRPPKRSSSKKTDGATGAKKRGTAEAAALNPGGASCSSTVVLPPKKRKLATPNQNKTETGTQGTQSQQGMNRETEETVQKLQEDYDTFIRQVGELAALEREKNKLLEKFLAVSSALTGSENPLAEAAGNNGNGTE